jgi:hypothetical protein
MPSVNNIGFVVILSCKFQVVQNCQKVIIVTTVILTLEIQIHFRLLSKWIFNVQTLDASEPSLIRLKIKWFQ